MVLMIVLFFFSKRWGCMLASLHKSGKGNRIFFFKFKPTEMNYLSVQPGKRNESRLELVLTCGVSLPSRLEAIFLSQKRGKRIKNLCMSKLQRCLSFLKLSESQSSKDGITMGMNCSRKLWNYGTNKQNKTKKEKMGEGGSHGWASIEERPWCSIAFKCLNDFGYIRCSPTYLMWSQK